MQLTQAQLDRNPINEDVEYICRHSCIPLIMPMFPSSFLYSPRHFLLFPRHSCARRNPEKSHNKHSHMACLPRFHHSSVRMHTTQQGSFSHQRIDKF